MAIRGRPVGTTKRDIPRAAARDIRDGKFDSIREAADAYRERYAMSDHSVRDFAGYIEDAIREMDPIEFGGGLRWYRILGARTKNKLRQPSEPRRLAKLRALKEHLTDVLGWEWRT